MNAATHLPPGDFEMISLLRRHAAALANPGCCSSCCTHLSDRTGRTEGRAGGRIARRGSGGARGRGRPPMADRDQGDGRQPLRPLSAVGAGRLRLPRHADHPRLHVDGQLVHPGHQAVGEPEALARGPGGAGRLLQGDEPAARRRQDAEGGQRVPLHRRDRHGRERAPRGRADREHRPQHLGLDERAAQRRHRAEPHCRTAWRSWPPSARRRRSSACSAPSGASTTR